MRRAASSTPRSLASLSLAPCGSAPHSHRFRLSRSTVGGQRHRRRHPLSPGLGSRPVWASTGSPESARARTRHHRSRLLRPQSNLLYLNHCHGPSHFSSAEMIWAFAPGCRIPREPQPRNQPHPQIQLDFESRESSSPSPSSSSPPFFTRYERLDHGPRLGPASACSYSATVAFVPPPSGWQASSSSPPLSLVRLQRRCLPRLALLCPWPLLRRRHRGPHLSPRLPPHLRMHNPWVSLIFFIKCAELDAAPLGCGTFLLLAAFFGVAWSWLTARRRAVSWALLLLWFPVPFYAYSVSWGSVPIFLPVWWPFSYYNLRYGLELLPALALALGFSAQFALAASRVQAWPPRPILPIDRRCPAPCTLPHQLHPNASRASKSIRRRHEKNIQAHRPYQLAIPPVLRSLLATVPVRQCSPSPPSIRDRRTYRHPPPSNNQRKRPLDLRRSSRCASLARLTHPCLRRRRH